jgi:hypothetical protein
MTRPWLPRRSLLAKEVRALFPIWLGTALVIGAASFVGGGFALPGLLAFVLGSVALGAQTIGHEYTHRTLDTLLAQPVDRRQLFLTKLAALAGPLVLLTALVWHLTSARPGHIVYLQQQGLGSSALLAVPALAFFVAPLLTMVARGTLGGAVFTLAVPMVLVLAGDLAGVVRYGSGAAADIDALKVAVVWWGTVAACAAGGVAGWMRFQRLEASECATADVEIVLRFLRGAPTAPARRGPPEGGPYDWRSSGSAPASGGPMESPHSWGPPSGGPGAHDRRKRRHPIALLVRKELRIQQITFVLGGLYAALALVAVAIEWWAPGATRQLMEAITVLTIAMLALLAGAVASADERHMGTHAWQLLQPVSSRTQWAIKAGVAFGCALLFGVALPVLLAVLQPGVSDAVGRMGLVRLTTTMALLTSVSLYVSSLGTSGIRALVISLGAVLGGWVLAGMVSVLLWEPASALVLREMASGLRQAFSMPADTLRLLAGGAVLLAIGVLGVMLTWFAMRNHRTAGTPAAVILPQVGALVLILAVCVALFNLMALAALPLASPRG